MSYRITYQATVSFVGDGAGPMEVPGSPSALFVQAGPIIVPGGNAPTSGNFGTAATALATDLAAQLQAAATLARLQAWGTGTGI